MRRDAERLAEVCGARMPAEQTELVRGVRRAKHQRAKHREGGASPLAVAAAPATREIMSNDSDSSDGSGGSGGGVDGGAGDSDMGGDSDAEVAEGPAEHEERAVMRVGGGGRTVISLLGRCNVGKSSLFNALCGGRRLASVSRQPGHTRRVQEAALSGSLGWLSGNLSMLMNRWCTSLRACWSATRLPSTRAMPPRGAAAVTAAGERAERVRLAAWLRRACASSAA